MLVPHVISSLWFFLCCQLTFSQNPIFGDGGLNQDKSTIIFSLTSNSDCSDNLKNIYDSEATIIGLNPNSIDTGPTDCTIRLTSQDQLPNIQLMVKIISANILDCETTLGIYDGQEGILLGSFDCNSADLPNRKTYATSGDTVTFRFKRPNPSITKFDIEIKVSRVRGGLDSNYGSDYAYFDKFPQEAIVGMIGGFYALILLVCIGIIIYFNLKYQGRLKRWEMHQLSTMKTGTEFGSRSQVNDPSRIWTMEMADKGPSSYYSRSQAETYSRKPRGTSEDGSSVVYDHDDAFQRNLMSTKRNQNRDRVASENTNFADSDQDDPDHFEEKVIRPRWRPRNRERKDHRPPSFEEAVREDSSHHSSEESEEDETDSSYDSTAKKRLTSSDEESSRSSRSPSETESESDYDSRRGGRAKRLKERKRKDKRRRRSSTDGETSSYRSGHRNKPAAAPPAAVPYAAYPPGQFVPVMAGPPAFQPVHMVPNYPPPQYPNEPQAAHRQPQVQPTDPPVYSYLVRRGYTPMEPNAGWNSPASSGSQRGPPEEPEAPLQSGVEYMRR